MTNQNKYITKEEFELIEIGNSLSLRFMLGKTEVIKKDSKEILLQFKSGCWKEKQLWFSRYQIKKIN